MTTFEVIEAQALELERSDRARLINRLIFSLDIDPEVEDAWATKLKKEFS